MVLLQMNIMNISDTQGSKKIAAVIIIIWCKMFISQITSNDDQFSLKT